MNRSWVRFPQAAQIRPPGSGWAFLYALTGRAAWCARGRRPAREIATREPAARSDRSRGPPWPRRRPRAPQPGPPIPPAPSTPVGPGVLACGLARRLEARPGPAAAHGHRSLAPVPPAPSTPVGLGCCCVAWRVGSKPGQAQPPPTGAAAWFSGPPQCGLACRAGILGRSAVCCYKRRQSEVFFVWISDPLLQTSSIRGLFR